MTKLNDKIKICSKCLYSSSHPLGITFNKQGICSGCEVHEEKNILNWNYRLSELKKLVKKYKSSKNNYDCIVPVTGGNDSYFILHVVKNILKLNPLVVCYNKYFNTKIGIKNLANLRIKFNCDILFQNINQNSVKRITRHTLMEHGNIYWPILAGQTSFPVQTSIKFKIPLIIWGAHQGLEQVGMFSHLHEVEMTRRYREDHDLFGNDENSLVCLDNDLKEEDVWQYRYPKLNDIRANGTRGIYLGNFIRWDPAKQHKMMVSKYNYTPSIFKRTFDTYDHTDCYNFMNLHDYLKLCKHGYSKVTDHVCREIRHKRIKKDLGISIVKFYESRKPEHLKLFCDWLGITEKSLNFVIDRFKNKKFWLMNDLNKWSFKGVSIYLKTNKNKKNYSGLKNIIFKKGKPFNKKDKYTFFGKGI